MAVFFIVGEMAGTGIVNLPQAISQTGWIGCGFLILCACMASFTGTKLGKSIDRWSYWLFQGHPKFSRDSFYGRREDLIFFRRMLEFYHSKRIKVQGRKFCTLSNNS